MIDQYLNLHPDMRLFHIGHDEVYYFLSNPACSEFKLRTGVQGQYDLFAYHLGLIVNYIRSKRPNLTLLIWHDVLQNLNMDLIMKYKLFTSVAPVLWSYREEMGVEGFASSSQAELFGRYKSLWGATAFKGATHEIATISDVKHYYQNQVSWISQLNSYIPTKWKNFDGMILTGWSRYDHFLSLCELLPYSIPTLAFSLIAWKEPFRSQQKSDLLQNKQLQEYVQKELQCSSSIHLNIGEHMNKPAPKCQFPGAGVYESMINVLSVWDQVDRAESFVDKYVTDLHVKYNYIHIKRGEECFERLKPAMNALKSFLDNFQKSMNEIFPEQVAIEWLETYFLKRYRLFYQRYQFIERALQQQKSWLPRPIPNSIDFNTNETNKR